MNKQELHKRILECRERSFFTDQTVSVLMIDKIIPMSWGLSKMVKIQSAEYTEEQAGLIIDVNAKHFKGAVLITLGWNDTYTVRYFEKNVSNGIVDVIERKDYEQKEVYVDVLVESIDSTIETRFED